MGRLAQNPDPGVARSLVRLTDAGAHLVLCRPDKRPLWRGWQKRRPSATVAQAHVDDAHGPLGVIPWSLRSTALDIDEGDPDALRSCFEPWADLASRRGRHFYYDDDIARRNSDWTLRGCSGQVRSGKGFLVMHGDGPVRLADALDRRVIGEHPWPRDLFDLAGLGPVLADPAVAAPIVAESVCTVAAPIQIALERVLQGGRGVALFDQCRWWAYEQGKGATLEAWKRRVLAYVTAQNERFHAPITAARVNSTTWSIASWTWDGGGSLDHSVMAQSRRGRAAAAVRRFLTYDRDRFMVARLDAGDRQVDVAHAFGVSQATVSYTRGRLERRRRAPKNYQRT